MKILITGKHGYISNSLKRYFEKRTSNIGGDINLLDLRGEEWLREDLSIYDIVIHCAALVHKDETRLSLEDYVRVNTELTKKLALKAKEDGVSFFVFFSTLAVYGLTGSVYENVVLTKDTIPNPKTKYGISKYQAEKELQELEDDVFHLAIIRPPFIYGNGCPGNYSRLREIVLKYNCVPQIMNQKSMIYVDNLCEFVYRICVGRKAGCFLPQDLPYRQTFDLCRCIAKYNGKKPYETKIFNPFIRFASRWVKSIRSSFGNLYYQEDESKMEFEYSLIDFDESIKRTENRHEYLAN